MPAQPDASDFVDSEFQSAQQTAYAAPLADLSAGRTTSNRPPTREEIESLVSEKQIKLAELRRAQEELERERASLEELRRRQMEFKTGREEMLQHLTRGIGLLEEAELTVRREAEQMARTLEEFRIALSKVHEINDSLWSQENFTVELTRALTVIENARMEWNAARLKFPVLSGETADSPQSSTAKNATPSLATMDLMQLCKIGFGLTWPLAALGLVILAVLLLRR